MKKSDAIEKLTNCVKEVQTRIQEDRDCTDQLLEPDTKGFLIEPILDALGWDIHNNRKKLRREYPVGNKSVDFACLLDGDPVLLVEAKALGTNLNDLRWIDQTVGYGNFRVVEWCVLTDGAHWRIYNALEKSEPKDRLFYTVSVDDASANIKDLAAKLSLLSYDRMRAPKRMIDTLWMERKVDPQIAEALCELTKDDEFVDLVKRRVPKLADQVRTSLGRSRLKIAYPKIEEHIAMLDGLPEFSRDEDRPKLHDGEPPETNVTTSDPGRPRVRYTTDMFKLRLLNAGDELNIKDCPNSTAVVVDGSNVKFRDQTISYAEWGRRAKGWKPGTAISIYRFAVLPDGRLLKTLQNPSVGSTRSKDDA